MLAVIFSTAMVGADFYSKEQYAFKTDYNNDYEYQWSSSAGSYLENDEDTFSWTAPDVNMPEDVEISVLVTDRSCGCQSKFEKTIKVLPSDESSTEDVICFNSTNLTQSNNDTELNGGHGNTTEVLTLDHVNDSVDIDALPEMLENASETYSVELNGSHENTTEVLTLDHVNDSVDIDALPEMLENASETYSVELNGGYENTSEMLTLGNANDGIDIDALPEVHENMSETCSVAGLSKSIPEISTLSFDDGTKVDVVFTEDSTGDDLAYAVLHVKDDEINEMLSRAEPILNQTELMDMTREPLAADDVALSNPANITQPDMSDIILRMPEFYGNETELRVNSQGLPNDVVQSGDAGENAAASPSETIPTIPETSSISIPEPIDDQSGNAECKINQSIST